MAEAPSWLQVASVNSSPDNSLLHLGSGERHAIVLALQQNASLLLIDESDGTATARSRGIRTVGTLGVLDEASARGWIELPEIFDRLRQTTFRAPLELMASMLDEDAGRNKR
jgi:predicted nucleic acid-binding protein